MQSLQHVLKFVKISGCPYQTLSQGSMEDRLNSMDNKLLLLHYLLSKLLAARMQQHNKPDKKIKLKVVNYFLKPL